MKHNASQDITNFTPNGGYEYGYHITGGYVTIMAYTATGFTKRIAYFSSPVLQHNGKTTGRSDRYATSQLMIIID